MEDTLEVRVTATVEADARLTAEVQGDAGTICEIRDYSDRAAWRKVHSTSIFYGDPALGEPQERDDAEALQRLAVRCAEAAADAVEAELTLGWVATSYTVGDIVEAIDGRGLELAGNAECKPFVRSVAHDFGDGQRTTLIVSG